jgi:hypothetical protein
MMKTLTNSVLSIALLATAFAVGCGASSGTDDAGIGGSTGTAGAGSGGAGGTAGVTPFGLSAGDTCFDIVSVANGSSDGCNLGVADLATAPNPGLVGTALPVNYDATTATLTVGTMGSLGAGVVTFNMGTLTRENTPAMMDMPTCTLHQTDTSMITVTATNEFDLAGTETEDTFAAACSAANVPTGGMCTSTWTWHMVKGTETPPDCK